MVGLNISGIDNTVIKYVEVKVNQTYNMKVLPFPYDPHSADPSYTEGTMDPGRIVPFMVEVRNEANGPDTVNLTIEGMGSGGDNWNAWFAAVSNTPDYTRNTKYIDFDEKLTVSNYGSDINYLPNSSTVYRMTIHLPTKQTAWVMIYIQSPVDSLANTVKTISIKGDSSGAGKDNPNDNKASIGLTILYPDLTISDVIKISSPNGKPQNGEIVTISVNIKNVGDIEATNVIIVMKIDGKEAKRAVVKRVLVDKDQLITFSWKAESGKHKITIEIDPDGTVIETNDQNSGINNNVKSRDVTVGTPGADILQAEAVQTVLLPLFLLLLVAAAVGIATMIYLKKKSEQ
jgi:subtilase family serine protease